MKNENKLKHVKNKISKKKRSQSSSENKIRIDTEADLYNLSLNKIKNTKLYNFYGKYYDKIYNKAIQMEKSNKKLNSYSHNKPKKKIIIKLKKIYVLKKNNSININNKNSKKENNKKYLKINSDKKANNNKSFFGNKNKSININNNNLFSNLNKNVFLPDSNALRKFIIKEINFEIEYNTIVGENLAVIGSIDELGLWDPIKSLKMNWNEGHIWKASFYLNNYNNNLHFEYKFIVITDNYVKYWEDGNNRIFTLTEISESIEPYINRHNDSNNIISFNNIMNQSFIYNINDYSLLIISHWNKL